MSRQNTQKKTLGQWDTGTRGVLARRFFRLYFVLMIERLTVVFLIILCILLGFYLILAPWDALFGPWADNYLLVYLTDKAGAPVIHRMVASNWFRGGVTGLGVMNIVIAIWEAVHFNQSVKMLQGGGPK